MKKTILLMLLLSCYFLPKNALAQGESLTELLETYINKNRYEEVHHACDIQTILAFSDKKILKELGRFDKETDLYALHTIQEIEMAIGDRTEKPEIRQQITERLVKQCSSKELLMRQLATKYLLSRALKADFNAAAKQKISELIRNPKKISNPKWILLTGLADMNSEEKQLKKIIAVNESSDRKRHGQGYWYSPTWLAKLTLARLGDESILKECMAEIEKKEVQIFRGKQLLMEHLGYLAQPLAVQKVVDYFNSDVQQLKPFHLGLQRYNLQALSVLSGLLDDFPVPSRDLKDYISSEIKTARAWVKTNKQFNIIR